MNPQRFIAGNTDGGDYTFPGPVFNMRAKDREVFVEVQNDYVFALESTSMTRGLADQETTLDMLFSFRGSVQSIHVLATTSSVGMSYGDIIALGDSVPSMARHYTYTGLTPDTRYYGWIAALGSLGDTIVSRIRPIAGETTLDVPAPVISSATVALNGVNIRMDWSVTDNKKVTDIFVLRTTDAGVKTNFDIIQNGVALSDTVATYTWTGGVDGTDYYFWLVARDAAGNFSTMRTTPNSLTAQLPDRNRALRKPYYTYKAVPGASGMLNITNFTLSFWVRLNAIPALAAARILSFEGAFPNIALIVLNGSGELLLNDSGVNSFNLGNSLADLKWHQITYSRNFTTRAMSVAIDGVVTQFTGTANIPQPVNVDLSRLCIGSYNFRQDRPIDFSIGEFYFSQNYHDLSSPSELSKFWSSNGPQDLGLRGELPRGN